MTQSKTTKMTRQQRLDAFSDVVEGDETNVERVKRVGPNGDKMRMRVTEDDLFKLYMILCNDSQPYVAKAIADVMSGKNGKGMNDMRKVLRKNVKKDVSQFTLEDFQEAWAKLVSEGTDAMLATRIPGEEDF